MLNKEFKNVKLWSENHIILYVQPVVFHDKEARHGKAICLDLPQEFLTGVWKQTVSN